MVEPNPRDSAAAYLRGIVEDQFVAMVKPYGVSEQDARATFRRRGSARSLRQSGNQTGGEA